MLNILQLLNASQKNLNQSGRNEEVKSVVTDLNSKCAIHIELKVIFFPFILHIPNVNTHIFFLCKRMNCVHYFLNSCISSSHTHTRTLSEQLQFRFWIQCQHQTKNTQNSSKIKNHQIKNQLNQNSKKSLKYPIPIDLFKFRCE